MHPVELRERALAMHDAGVPFRTIWRSLGLSRNTVTKWLYGARAQSWRRRAPDPRCPRCATPPRAPDRPADYAYLLGLYLGDGHLVTSTKVPVLRIACAGAWPGLIDQCEMAMLAVLAKRVQRIQKQGCVSVQSYATHWPCVLPQHGPGRKHTRPIVLTEWQEPIVAEHGGSFLRGLIHSDGCRFTNRVVVSGTTYSYPRYMFTNESADIMRLCQRSLDRLSIDWRMSRRNTLSVAKRAAVARLDEFVGPKS